MRFLEAFADDPDRLLRDVDLLDTDERARMLTDWNDTRREVPDTTVPELFAAQVALAPDRTAVVLDDIALSYVELTGGPTRSRTI